MVQFILFSKIKKAILTKRNAYEEGFEFLKNVNYVPLSRPLTQKEIRDFEQMNNIFLPDDYKHFLTHIGNGIKIKVSLNKYSWFHYGKQRIVKGINLKTINKIHKLLSEEFLFDNPFSSLDGEKPTDWFVDCENPLLRNDELCNKCNNKYECPFACTDKICNDYGYPYYRGVFPICYAGCTYEYYLVLTGKHCGEVWLDNDGQTFDPIEQTFTDFLKWVISSKHY